MANNKLKKVVTTSWDDGNIADLKLLDLLNKYHLKGTFYIPKNCEFRGLTDQQVKLISQTQEVGAHTLDHVNLKAVSEPESQKQILGSKEYLEQLLGKPVEMFCYPKGFYNQQIKKIVQQAGFLGARTIKRFSLDYPKDNFELATTISVFPQIRQSQDKLTRVFFYANRGIKNLFRLVDFKKKTKLSFKELNSWKNIAINSFDYIAKNGGVFHFWGHSWSIERYNLWPELEEVFSYIADKNDILYLTNSDLFSTFPGYSVGLRQR